MMVQWLGCLVAATNFCATLGKLLKPRSTRVPKSARLQWKLGAQYTSVGLGFQLSVPQCSFANWG